MVSWCCRVTAAHSPARALRWRLLPPEQLGPRLELRPEETLWPHWKSHPVQERLQGPGLERVAKNNGGPALNCSQLLSLDAGLRVRDAYQPSEGELNCEHSNPRL